MMYIFLILPFTVNRVYFAPCGITLVPGIKNVFILCTEQRRQDNSEFMPLKNVLKHIIRYLNSLEYWFYCNTGSVFV